MRRYDTRSLSACCLSALACCAVFLHNPPPVRAALPGGEPSTAPLLDRLRESVDRLLVPRCLTPAAGRALQDLIAAGALRSVLRDEFSLARVDLTANQIELEIQDRPHRSYAIKLVLPNSTGGTPDGKGNHFLFYLVASPARPNLQAETALLAAAALFDGAIPATAWERCSGDNEHGVEDRRYPRALVLASAMIQVLVLAGAILFGVRALRSLG